MDDGSQVTLVHPGHATCHTRSVIQGTDTKAPGTAKDPYRISVGRPAAEADNDWFAINALRLKAPAGVPEIEQVLRLWVQRNEFGFGQSHGSGPSAVTGGWRVSPWQEQRSFGRAVFHSHRHPPGADPGSLEDHSVELNLSF